MTAYRPLLERYTKRRGGGHLRVVAGRKVWSLLALGASGGSAACGELGTRCNQWEWLERYVGRQVVEGPWDQIGNMCGIISEYSILRLLDAYNNSTVV